MQTEDNGNAGISPEAQNGNAGADAIAADIHALYDQFSQPQKTWFMEQLRRGARGETTFLLDEEQSFEAWLAQPVPVVQPAPIRPNTIGVEDALGEAESRLQAAAAAATVACTDRRAGDGLAFIIHDVCDIVRDASDTLADMRREGGAA